MIAVGFTGSRKGMSAKQLEKIQLLIPATPFTAHHGDCIGADEQFDRLVQKKAFYRVVHAPIDDTFRAFVKDATVLPALPYLDRNHAIVDACNFMIATPRSPVPDRSGTWATIRYAMKSGKPVHIILPNGAVVREN